jgi:membrane-bound lytic murein transglycosylase D
MSFLGNLTNRVALYIIVPASFLTAFIIIADQQKEFLDLTTNYISDSISKVLGKSERVTAVDSTDDTVENVTAATEQMPTAPEEVKTFVKTEMIKATDVIKTFKQEDEINKIPLEYANQAVVPQDIIDDKLNLLPQDFKIEQSLKQRVGFWFNIYTKYTSHFVVIHDADRPWIIYRVVDLREIYSRHINRFAKDILDKKTVAKAKIEVRGMLKYLAQNNGKLLSGEKLRISELFKEIKGNKKRILMQAAKNIREQRGQKDFYRKGIIYSSRYLSQMEEIFARYDLPIELVRLPLVESSFNESAESKVGASGIWQFMPGMGKKYLKVGDLVDERNSPIKATEAAAKLMLSNFRVLKTWPLAITAYNHGAGGLIKAGKKLRTKDLGEIVAKFRTKSFSFASQNFYSEFMAALYAEKYQDDIFGALAKYPPLPGETFLLRHKMRAKTLVDIVGITMEELKLFNPDLRKQIIAGFTFLPSGYHVRLPVGRRARLDLYYQDSSEVSQSVKSKDTQI